MSFKLENTRPTVIAGPCSAESREQVLGTALELKTNSNVKYFRAGLWKPRTRPNSFEGVGEEGIRWLSSDARWPVWTSLRLYRGILDSIEKLDYDVFNNRAFVKKSVKAFEIPISFLISRIK